MIAIGEHASRTAGDPIHGTREATADRHHAAAEGIAVTRLDDQMRVISLQRVVHQPETRSGASGRKRLLDLVHEARRPQ